MERSRGGGVSGWSLVWKGVQEVELVNCGVWCGKEWSRWSLMREFGVEWSRGSRVSGWLSLVWKEK